MVRGRGTFSENRAKWQRTNWRREASEALYEVRRSASARSSHKPAARPASYRSVLSTLLVPNISSNVASTVNAEEVERKPAVNYLYIKELREDRASLLNQLCTYPHSDLIERLLQIIASNVERYTKDDLQYVLKSVFPSLFEAFSAACCKVGSMNDELLSTLLHWNPDSIVIGSKVTSDGFISVLQNIYLPSKTIFSWPPNESWEDIDAEDDSEGWTFDAMNLRSIVLINPRFTMTDFLKALPQMAQLTDLHIHSAIYSSQEDAADARFFLAVVLSELRDLRRLSISYCGWLTLEVLSFWAQDLKHINEEEGSQHPLRVLTITGTTRSLGNCELVVKLNESFRRHASIELVINKPFLGDDT